jgi:hypothetical protein
MILDTMASPGGSLEYRPRGRGPLTARYPRLDSMHVASGPASWPSFSRSGRYLHGLYRVEFRNSTR